VNTYQVRFHARGESGLPEDAAQVLRRVLDDMPGTGRVHGASHDPERRIVAGEFQVEVDHGIAEAARDASRFAKEALKGAGMGGLQLVELWIALRDSPGA
jgi:hypothetical protein